MSDNSVLYACRAWLHRRDRATWEFTPSQRYGELIHTTSKGTVYAIISSHKYGRPYWVGRRCEGRDGHEFWATCERHLRAHSIEFEGEGVYIFPQKEDWR